MADEKLEKIYRAALNTFAYNCVDIFMDCPSRERAGWLCDGYFTGRVEHLLTGENRTEHDFLENFLLPKKFERLPKGMLPMCYPSDHPDGNFIPTWADVVRPRTRPLRERIWRSGHGRARAA